MKEYICKGAAEGKDCSVYGKTRECRFMNTPHRCDPLHCGIKKHFGDVFCFFENPNHRYCSCVPLPFEMVMKRIIKEYEEGEKSG